MKKWVHWLAEEMAQHPIQKKVLVVDSHKDGHQLVEQLARQGCHMLNLRIVTLEDLMKDMLVTWQGQASVEWVEPGAAWYWMRNLLKELQKNNQLQYYQQVVLSPGMISAMLEAITELRYGCITSETLDPDSFINPAKSADLKRMLSKWETMLIREEKVDGLRVLQWLQQHPPSLEPHTRYYLAPTPPLSKLDEALLQALFGEQLEALEKGPEWEPGPPEAALHLSHSGSAWQEVRDLLRNIKTRHIPLDQCLILLPVKEPYTNYLEALACRYDLPMTFGHGTSVNGTKPGKLFSLLLKWIQSDYQAAIFCDMLRGGLLQLPAMVPAPVMVEHALKKHKVGWGKERYVEMLKAAQAKDPENTPDFENLVTLFQQMMPWLPDTQPGEGKNQGNWIANLQQWWKTYARAVNEADGEGKAAIEKVFETAARYYDPTASLDEALEELKLHAGGIRVGAHEPESGKIHCQGLSQGQFSPRSQVFIPGLSARLFPGSPSDGPVLLDRERINLGTLQLTQEAPFIKEQQLSRVLSGAAQALYFSMPAFDPLEHREEAPSAAFLQLYRLQSGNPMANYKALRDYLNRHKKMGDILPAKAVELLDGWEDKLMYEKRGPAQVSALRPHLDPWTLRGRKAWQTRLGGTLNPYNGLVQVDPAVVDPRVNQQLCMSASQLEQLAKCPYVHFLQRLLNLWPEDEVVFQADQWLNALDRGSLLHSVYEYYYRQVLLGEAPCEALVLKTLEEQVETYQQRVPPPSQRVFLKEVEELTESCKVFYRSEQLKHEHQQPVYLELKFGMEETHPVLGDIPPMLVSLENESGFYFRGSVDRVDRLNENEYEIIDYKTGSTYNFHESKPLDQGRRLQHALYAQVTEKILHETAQQPQAQVVKASYYFPTIKGRGVKTTYVQTPMIKTSLNKVLTSLLNAVAAGVFVDWGSSFDRRWDDYKPILQQNPGEGQQQDMFEQVALLDQGEPWAEALKNLLEVKKHD